MANNKKTLSTNDETRGGALRKPAGQRSADMPVSKAKDAERAQAFLNRLSGGAKPDAGASKPTRELESALSKPANRREDEKRRKAGRLPDKPAVVGEPRKEAASVLRSAPKNAKPGERSLGDNC